MDNWIYKWTMSKMPDYARQAMLLLTLWNLQQWNGEAGNLQMPKENCTKHCRGKCKLPRSVLWEDPRAALQKWHFNRFCRARSCLPGRNQMQRVQRPLGEPWTFRKQKNKRSVHSNHTTPERTYKEATLEKWAGPHHTLWDEILGFKGKPRTILKGDVKTER